MTDFDRKWKQFDKDFAAAEKSTNRMIKISFCVTTAFWLLLFILMGAAIVWIVGNI